MNDTLEEKVQNRIDRTVAASTEISMRAGTAIFGSMIEVLEFAKMMSVAREAVPEHLRSNPGACFAVVMQAIEWNFSPFAVAAKSYVSKQGGRMAYESQLIHAVVEARAPLNARLRHEIIGEGDERRCRVWGTFKGEDTPHEFITETLGSIKAAIGKNDYGKLKGSPLWETDPTVQLFYRGTRTWARMYCPEVLMGIYSKEEIEEAPSLATGGASTDEDHSAGPSIARRLPGPTAQPMAGFNADAISVAAEPEILEPEKPAAEPAGKPKRSRKATAATDAPSGEEAASLAAEAELPGAAEADGPVDNAALDAKIIEQEGASSA